MCIRSTCLLALRTKKRNCANSVRFALLLCFFFVEITAFAQQRISGAITNKTTGAPVSGATVTLEGDLLAYALTTKSDVEGRFSFVNLSPGRYDISVKAETFHQQQATITLGPRGTRQIDFELSPAATIREQVTVNARAKLSDETEAATATTLTHEQIESLPSARRTQLTEIITPFVSSAVGSHDNLVHLRGNELSLNTFINGVSFFDGRRHATPAQRAGYASVARVE
jgi:hypothetical protein